MKKNWIIIALTIFLIISFTFSGCSQSEKASKELVVYVWDGYLPEELAEEFEKETGINLNVNLISDNLFIVVE